jgi:hypothetical protein
VPPNRRSRIKAYSRGAKGFGLSTRCRPTRSHPSAPVRGSGSERVHPNEYGLFALYSSTRLSARGSLTVTRSPVRHPYRCRTANGCGSPGTERACGSGMASLEHELARRYRPRRAYRSIRPPPTPTPAESRRRAQVHPQHAAHIHLTGGECVNFGSEPDATPRLRRQLTAGKVNRLAPGNRQGRIVDIGAIRGPGPLTARHAFSRRGR